MRALVLFNADFAVWPVHILAALGKRIPGLTADGVVVVDRSVSAWLAQQKTFGLDEITASLRSNRMAQAPADRRCNHHRKLQRRFSMTAQLGSSRSPIGN